MSVFGITTGAINSERITLSDTSATTVLSAGEKRLAIVGILLVNHSTGTLTPTVDIYDGSVATIIRDNASLADQAREVVTLPGFIRMKPNDVLRVTANANLAVHVSYVDMGTGRNAT